MANALIIDDNALNNDILRTLLNKAGVNATCIESPRQLLPILEQLDTLHVIFLDLEIPNFDGYQVLRDLKAIPRLRNIPIVAYTVHTSEIDETRKAGFDGFLGKPLNAQRFPEQIKAILNGELIWEI